MKQNSPCALRGLTDKSNKMQSKDLLKRDKIFMVNALGILGLRVVGSVSLSESVGVL